MAPAFSGPTAWLAGEGEGIRSPMDDFAPSSFVSVAEIQRRVCRHYGLAAMDMVTARRSADIARPRQVAMYLAKNLTPQSLPQIGRRFGQRHHSTVMHAIGRIEELRATDATLDADVRALTAAIIAEQTPGGRDAPQQQGA